jgi:hypothetical protein
MFHPKISNPQACFSRSRYPILVESQLHFCIWSRFPLVLKSPVPLHATSPGSSPLEGGFCLLRLTLSCSPLPCDWDPAIGEPLTTGAWLLSQVGVSVHSSGAEEGGTMPSIRMGFPRPLFSFLLPRPFADPMTGSIPPRLHPWPIFVLETSTTQTEPDYRPEETLRATARWR